MILNLIGILCFNLPVYAVGDILLYLYGEPLALDDIKDMPSTFGGEIPYEGLQARIKYAEPAQGCQPLEPPPESNSTTLKWVVLIARNNCTFETKIRNAQNANYDGVIVHNIGSNYIEEMSVNNATGIEIPSVFIGEYDGSTLRQKFASDELYYVVITPDAPFNINTHLLLPFAIVVAICFVIMILFMMVKCIKDRRRQRRQRLPTSALNQMLIHKFQKGDPYETCAICLDDYIEGEKLRVLPCAHAYHSKCIDPWLTNSKRVCPVCKRRVLAGDEEQGTSDSDTDDDTTPLVNPTNQNRNNGGGTFDNDAEASVLSTSARLRNLREIGRLFQFARHHAVFGDNHSINGENSIEVSTSSTDSSDTTTTTTTTSDTFQPCVDEEVHVHTRPENAEGNADSSNDVII
ncbi:ring finger and protease associated domain-containing [Holotrichia oblita]|uniref:Ring finger and protease associated domain-containing n=1 Tax=Holotrichia oblita TaxID=644536 RepID=A0ACB9TC41_HOLOL|nr:ring finger and protease associated domain-containing [Holotrichia oblita]